MWPPSSKLGCWKQISCRIVFHCTTLQSSQWVLRLLYSPRPPGIFSRPSILHLRYDNSNKDNEDKQLVLREQHCSRNRFYSYVVVVYSPVVLFGCYFLSSITTSNNKAYVGIVMNCQCYFRCFTLRVVFLLHVKYSVRHFVTVAAVVQARCK